jgi:hypothetical protein
MTSPAALILTPDIPRAPAVMRGKLTVNRRIPYLGSELNGVSLITPLRGVAPDVLDTKDTYGPRNTFRRNHNIPPTANPPTGSATRLRHCRRCRQRRTRLTRPAPAVIPQACHVTSL